MVLCMTGALLLPMGALRAQSVITTGSPWRYLDTGTLPPPIGGVSDWRAANYNAAAAGSTWKMGNGPLGYGDPGLGTTTSFGPNANAKYVTTYFWKSFQRPAGAVYGAGAGGTYNQIRLRVMRDDGIVVYVNGQELRRDNMPPMPAVINNSTPAQSIADGTAETQLFETIHDAIIINASNVIAVELHQINGTSSDTRFDVSLDLIKGTPCYGDARPGISTQFENAGSQGLDTVLHVRPELEEYNFEDQDTEMNWKFTEPSPTEGIVGDLDAVTGQPLPSKALGTYGGTFRWDSEPIDCRNFENIRVLMNIQAVAAVANSWTTNENVKVTLRTSNDGIVYTDKPWLNITHNSAGITLGHLDDRDVNTYRNFDSSVGQSGAPAIDLDPLASLRIRIDARTGVDSRALYFDDIAVVGDSLVGDSFGSYMFLKLPADSSEADRATDADPDGDGLENLLEYAFRSDPLVPSQVFSTGAQIEPEVFTTTDGYVFCRFRLPAYQIEGEVGTGFLVSDINVRPQIAFDSFDELDGWNDGTIGVNYFTQDDIEPFEPFEETADGSGSVIVTCKTIQPEALTHSNLFVRVRVGLRYPPYLHGTVSECPL
jgi:hypothetical protein